MLPDIRVVVTAIATTVLILVGMGLMASIRLNHQGLSGGSVVASSQSDSMIGNRITWRQAPEQVASLPHETINLTAFAREERELADPVLAGAAEPNYALAGERIDPDLQIATLLAREQEVPTDQASELADPLTTASIISAQPAANTPTPAPDISKKVATVPPATKAEAKKPAGQGAAVRAGQARPTARAAKPRRARTAKSEDKGLLETLFSLDQLH